MDYFFLYRKIRLMPFSKSLILKIIFINFLVYLYFFEALSFKLLGSGLVNSIQAKKVVIELNEKSVREPNLNFFKHKGFKKARELGTFLVLVSAQVHQSNFRRAQL